MTIKVHSSSAINAMRCWILSFGFMLWATSTTVHCFTTGTNSMAASARRSVQVSSSKGKDIIVDNGEDTIAPVESRRTMLSTLILGGACTVMFQNPEAAVARLESVNRPELLPSESGQNVIQTEKFLTSGQAKRMDNMLAALERDTGFRVRLLCQSYPNTPGLAIRDYWDLGKEGQKDDMYVVLVVDQFGGRGNSLNFNVGEGVKFALPNIFWTRLQAKYGTTFYVRDNGIDLAIINALEAIATCLRSEDGFCTDVPKDAPSLKSLGLS